MKLITKDTTEFLNILYGDDEDYSYITKEELKTILEEHMKSLEKIYDYLERTIYTYEQYDLGDVMNLLQQFIENLEFKERD